MFLRPTFWLGVGAVVAYEFMPQIMKAMRPVAIQVIKTGMAVADQMKVAGGEGKESFEDIMAGARAQYEAEKGQGEAPVAEKVRPRGKRAPKTA